MPGEVFSSLASATPGNERERVFEEITVTRAFVSIQGRNTIMMDIDNVTMITRTALYTIIKCASPLLLVSLVVGLAISIFQTVTSIQEQTLTFVPKVLGIFTAIMILGHWILNEIVTYTVELWNGFSLYIR